MKISLITVPPAVLRNTASLSSPLTESWPLLGPPTGRHKAWPHQHSNTRLHTCVMCFLVLLFTKKKKKRFISLDAALNASINLCTRLLWTPTHITIGSGPRCLVTKLTLTKMFFLWTKWWGDMEMCRRKREGWRDKRKISDSREWAECNNNKKNGLTYENNLKWAFRSFLWTLIIVTEQQAEGESVQWLVM